MKSLELEIGRAASFENIKRFKDFVGEVSTEQSLKEVEKTLSFCSAILFSLFDSSKIYGLGSLLPAYTPLNKELKRECSSFFIPSPGQLNKASHCIYELRFYARGSLFKVLSELHALRNGDLKNENLKRYSGYAEPFSQLMEALIEEIRDGAILIDQTSDVGKKQNGKNSYFLMKVLVPLSEKEHSAQLKLHHRHCLNGYSALVISQ